MPRRKYSDGDLPPDCPRTKQTDTSDDMHEVHPSRNDVMMNINQNSETLNNEKDKVNIEDKHKEVLQHQTPFGRVGPYNPPNKSQNQNLEEEIDAKDDQPFTTRRKMMNVKKRNDKSDIKADKRADQHNYDDTKSRFAARHIQREKRNDKSDIKTDKRADQHNYDDTKSRFAARHIQREKNKIGEENVDTVSKFAANHMQRETTKSGNETASSLSTSNGDIVSKVRPTARLRSSNEGEEDSEEGEQLDIEHQDDDAERPGAFPVGVLTQEQDYEQVMSDAFSQESQNQHVNPIIAVPAPDTDAIQHENAELRRQLQERETQLQERETQLQERETQLQEREKPVVAQSARIIHTAMCGLSRKQVLIVSTLLVTSVVVAVVVAAILLDPKEDRTLSPTISASPTTSASPTISASPSVMPTSYEEIIVNLFLEVEPSLNVDQVKGSEAFQWILSDLYTKEMFHIENSNRHLLERYVVAVLYYATNGDSWSSSYAFLDPISHCNWGRGVSCHGGFVDSIDISINSLSGTIPSAIGILTALKTLKLSRNSLRGSIPTEIGLLTDLDILSLWSNAQHRNYLTGTIPSEIGLLTIVRSLSFGSNSLTGTIPSEIGLLTNLGALYLDNNFLTGTIPSVTEQLNNLKIYRFDRNSLTGTIPSEIGLLTTLSHLWLYENSLTGTVPSEIGLLTNLERLLLYENDLTGDVSSLFCVKKYTGSPPVIDCDKITCTCCLNSARSPC